MQVERGEEEKEVERGGNEQVVGFALIEVAGGRLLHPLATLRQVEEIRFSIFLIFFYRTIWLKFIIFAMIEVAGGCLLHPLAGQHSIRWRKFHISYFLGISWYKLKASIACNNRFSQIH